MGVLQGTFSDREHESYLAYKHFTVLPLFTLLFPTGRFLFDRFVFEVFSAPSSVHFWASVVQLFCW